MVTYWGGRACFRGTTVPVHCAYCTNESRGLSATAELAVAAVGYTPSCLCNTVVGQVFVIDLAGPALVDIIDGKP